MTTRRTQMKWLIALTAISLMPVYGLLGWQTGPHGAKEVWAFIWTIEAIAWSLRALVEAWALVYLFSTNTQDQKAVRTLHWIEGALIGLIAVTVTLLIVANKMNQSINELWAPLFWLWAISVASFAPLMFAGVGIAYRVHNEPIKEDTTKLDSLFNTIEKLQNRLKKLEENEPNPVEKRRQQIKNLYSEGLTQSQMANQLGVSIGTISNDIKTMGLNGK